MQDFDGASRVVRGMDPKAIFRRQRGDPYVRIIDDFAKGGLVLLMRSRGLAGTKAGAQPLIKNLHHIRVAPKSNHTGIEFGKAFGNAVGSYKDVSARRRIPTFGKSANIQCRRQLETVK